MDYSDPRKNPPTANKQQGALLTDMKFPVVTGIEESMWIFQGSIEKEVELPGVFKKKSCGHSMGLGF